MTSEVADGSATKSPGVPPGDWRILHDRAFLLSDRARSQSKPTGLTEVPSGRPVKPLVQRVAWHQEDLYLSNRSSPQQLYDLADPFRAVPHVAHLRGHSSLFSDLRKFGDFPRDYEPTASLQTCLPARMEFAATKACV